MTLAFDCSGAGRDMLLLHGWGFNRRIWGEFGAGLRALGRVTNVDLPGHGESAPMADCTLESLADALAELCPRPVVAIGWSLGALATLMLAQRHPERVAALVLFGATPRFTQAADWDCAVAPTLWNQFADELAHAGERTRRRFLSLQLGQAAQERQLLKRLRAWASVPGASLAGVQTGLTLLAHSDLRPQLPTIAAPALVVHGTRDRLAPVAAGRFLAAQLANARWHELADAGHAPFLSHSAWCLATVSDFLHERNAEPRAQAR